MCKEFKAFVFSLITLVFTISASAQQINTTYFIENSPTRHYLNPSFQPLSNLYIGIPFLGHSQFGVFNNSLTLKDVFYNYNNETISFLGVNGDKVKFYNKLKQNSFISSDFQLDFLNFGFRLSDSYWSFSLSEKANTGLNIPKDMAKFLLFGTTNISSNTFNFSSFDVNSCLYTEAAFGYSKRINNVWSVGAKLKVLLGTANFSTVSNSINLSADVDEWSLKGAGNVHVTSGVDLNGTGLRSFDPIAPASIVDIFKPTGFGTGIDLGVTMKPAENLSISAALLDLGFINWKRNAKNVSYALNYKYDGNQNMDLSSDYRLASLYDSIWSEINSSINDTIYTDSVSTSSYSTYLSPKVNVGVEYSFLNDKLSLGLLSRTIFQNKTVFEELTASVNGRPTDWFNASLSYSVFNGKFSNIGAGLGLRTGFIHWSLSADYISLNNSRFNTSLNALGLGTDDYKILVPYNSNSFNVSLGVNLVFGNRRDADKDGVDDKKDVCPDTPFGVIVDKKGCPVDTDEDGVPDYLDKCPTTLVEVNKLVDEKGCPADTDKDSVPDYLDKCPDTPIAAIGFVDDNGCPIDTDKDSVPDYIDKCLDTQVNIKVDSLGCAIDSDSDSVPDYLDLCPDSPFEAIGMVDKFGCPVDSDGDGVYDYLKKQPKIPGGTQRNGISKNGTQNNGLPVVSPEVKSLFQKALQGIRFGNGSARIMVSSHTILNQIANVLIVNPTYMVEIRGHTDNVGNSKLNEKLSSARALSVKKYLVSKGVPAARMEAKGYGDKLPAETNRTFKGRSMNRRVEFIVSYEEITFE